MRKYTQEDSMILLESSWVFYFFSRLPLLFPSDTCQTAKHLESLPVWFLLPQDIFLLC